VSGWLLSFLLFLVLLCQRGEIRGVNLFDAMRSQQLEFHVLSVESSFLGVSLRVAQNSIFIVILLPKYSVCIRYGHVSFCAVACLLPVL